MQRSIPVVMILVLAGATAFAQAVPAPVTTVWDTGFGLVTIVQEGAIIHGSYPYSSGRLVGVIEGNVIYGYWWESDDSTGCGPQGLWCGPFRFVLSADWKSFVGYYDKASRGVTMVGMLGTGWTWNGTLQSGSLVRR